MCSFKVCLLPWEKFCLFSFHLIFFDSCHFLHRATERACHSLKQTWKFGSQDRKLSEQGEFAHLPMLKRSGKQCLIKQGFLQTFSWALPLCSTSHSHSHYNFHRNEQEIGAKGSECFQSVAALTTWQYSALLPEFIYNNRLVSAHWGSCKSNLIWEWGKSMRTESAHWSKDYLHKNLGYLFTGKVLAREMLKTQNIDRFGDWIISRKIKYDS